MRIAYVINSVEGGGAAAPVPAVARVLADHGAEVRILALTGRDRRGLAAMLAAGLEVNVRGGGETDHVAALRWLDRAIAARPPDLIWTSLTRATLLGQIVGQRRRIPVASWQHAAYLRRANRWLLRARRARSALWIADSHCVAGLTRARLGVPEARLAVWPLFAADPALPQARPWRPGQPLRIGSLGRLHPVKGYDVLVEALRRLRGGGFRSTPFEVEIAGDGGERAALEQAIAAAALPNVRLIGFTERPRDFLATLHLYVQPSRSEGLCIAVHEAMTAGLPAIASAVGEMPYSIIDGVLGRVVPPADPDALAAALADLLARPETLAATGAAARAHVLDRFGAAAFAAAGAAVMRRLAPVLSPASAAPDQSASRARNGRPA